MARPMKMPNGYGAVVKLSGKRRKPYAVRITVGRTKDENGHYKQKIKYLEYFENYKDAVAYLADYNRQMPVAEHQSIESAPTFKEIYEMWCEYKMNLKKAPSQSTMRQYKLAYGRYEELHDRRFSSIRLKDLQPIADKWKEKSESTVTITKALLSQLYEYAIKYEYVDKNYCELVTWEYTNTEIEMHKPFTDDEIKLLWDNKDDLTVQWVLMMIYTGVRASEFISILNKNIKIDERYLIGGMKTEAGTDRVIPIHEAVYPYFKRNMSKSKFLINNLSGQGMSYVNFRTKYFDPCMKRFGLQHNCHDTRHTFASLAYKYGIDELKVKLIMGHSVQDITKGVYTHVEPEELVKAVNKITV